MEKYLKKVMFSKEDIVTKAFKKEYDDKLIEILNRFMSICNENHLHYVLSYGSVLGAIRHNGIIPWDDDIDVCMPRPDYEKFIDVCKNTDIGHYKNFIINETENYIEPYIKFADTNTSLLYNRDIPYVCGVMIDVFPIDGAADDERQWKKDSDMYNMLHRFHGTFLTPFSIKSFWSFLTTGGYKHAILSLIVIPFRTILAKIVWNKMQKIEKSHSYKDSNYVAFYHRCYEYKDRIPKKWIEETVMHKFESTVAPVPADYDAYLKYFYNDYMQVPPPEKRDRHSIEYINLERRETYREILSKIE